MIPIGVIEFEVEGSPVPKGRPKFRVVKMGKGSQLRPVAQAYTPAETRAAEQAFIALSRRYAPRKPLAGPLAVNTVFVVKPPKSFPSDRSRDWPTVAPDDDNYRKLALDAMSGFFWANDAQVCGGSSFKIYGDRPRTFVQIYQLGPEDVARVRALIGEAPSLQPALFGEKL